MKHVFASALHRTQCAGIAAGILVCMSLSATGCTTQLNERVGLAGVALPALESPDAKQTEHSTAKSRTTSLAVGHDRGNWQQTTIAVPVRQVEHHPSYNHPIDLTDLSHRDSGAYPSASEAVVREPNRAVHLGEVPVNFVGFLWATVTSPWQMTAGGEPPLQARCGQNLADYDRMPYVVVGNLARWWTVPEADGQSNGGKTKQRSDNGASDNPQAEDASPSKSKS